MNQISLLIKPASSLCNLRCRYCFYSDVSHNRNEESMGIMSEEVMHALIDRTMETNAEQINYCFQGGEPCVAGIEYFHKFIAYVNKTNNGKKVTYAIQTNGTLIDHNWVKLFRENHFLVGISIDGFIRNHDYFRKEADGKGTWKKILYNIRMLNNADISYNILTVLTHELSSKPEELFQFILKNQFEYVQLIPCLPSLKGDEPTDRFALKPHDFANFYKKFFDLWYEEYQKGHYISVTLFDNVIPMYAGIHPEQCGMLGKCALQTVVEGNGNVYPCDFYVLDEYCCGNVKNDSIETMMHHNHARTFLNEKRRSCSQCTSCRFVNMCHGNCRRLSVCYFDENYCGYQEFLEYSMMKMRRIALSMSQRL